MAWGTGDEMTSLSGQYDLTHPTRENLNYRYSANPGVACALCEHFTAPSDCDLLGLVRAVDVCDAYAPTAHPEPVDLDALDIQEGEDTMTSTELEKFIDDGCRRLTACEHKLPSGTAKARVRRMREDLLALKARYCVPPDAKAAIESWRKAYRPDRRDHVVPRSTPESDAAIRWWRQNYSPAREAERRRLTAAVPHKMLFGPHHDPTVYDAPPDDAEAAIRAFRKAYKR